MDKEVFDWINAKLNLDMAAEDFALSKLTPEDWETIASRCNYGRDWCKLLDLKPEFADRCPWDALSGSDWEWLLSKKPQFADRCNWKKLDGYDWSCLLLKQPQFAKNCPGEKLGGCDWSELRMRLYL